MKKFLYFCLGGESLSILHVGCLEKMIDDNGIRFNDDIFTEIWYVLDITSGFAGSYYSNSYYYF
jgi:hypothetical protein